jgi:hypothetical protein
VTISLAHHEAKSLRLHLLPRYFPAILLLLFARAGQLLAFDHPHSAAALLKMMLMMTMGLRTAAVMELLLLLLLLLPTIEGGRSACFMRNRVNESPFDTVDLSLCGWRVLAMKPVQ